ncbi:DUF998 domain-containing protein [Crossiella sp. SN42]|uniref:DUF998 domain-containing protein n=1 Tax=Crossiella sp. SN42 TaxID=2944808 RepID=UPI00207D5F71|nr:DUF998 domain-containing protein [Crossiella sp. SN42]MCO1576786.1 DUF998 domain-containing protein [Crossiella sp. SN42]
MTTTSRATIRPAPPPVAFVLLGVAGLLIGYLGFAYTVQVDPLWDPVSDYLFHAAPLFLAAVLCILIGGGLIVSRLPQDRPASVLFGLWAGGLLSVAAFPGNVSSTVSTVSGELHRFGGAVFMSCLPVAALRIAHVLSTTGRRVLALRRVRWAAVASLLTAASFGLAQLFPVLPQGLLQRVALVAHVLLLLALAPLMRSASR